jgi:hypothetical protein
MTKAGFRTKTATKSPDTGLDASPVGRIEIFETYAMRMT